MLLLFRYANWSRQRHIFPPITFTKNLQLRIASFTPRRINKIIKMLPYTVHTKPVWADSWLLQILVSIIDLRSYSYNPPPSPFSPSPFWSDFKHFFIFLICVSKTWNSPSDVYAYLQVYHSFGLIIVIKLIFIKNCQAFKKQNTMKICNNILL